MTIGVIIPTVPGRAREVEACLRSHEHPKAFLHVVFGQPTCGDAWRRGMAQLVELGVGDLEYVLFTADDLIAHHDYLHHALAAVEAGFLPAPMLYGEDGERQQGEDGPPGSEVSFSRVPFMPWDLAWEFMPEMPSLHYYSDCWVGDRCRERGWEIRVCEGYAFVHTWAQAGRIHTDMPDRALYEKDAYDHPYRDLERRSGK